MTVAGYNIDDDLADDGGVFTSAERDAAGYMTLDAEPTSEGARALVDALALGLWQGKPDRLRPRPGKPFVTAVGAVVADLLWNRRTGRNGWAYRSFHLPTFTGERVGYRGFVDTMAALETQGFIRRERGHQQWSDGTAFGSAAATRFRTWAMASRFRAMPKLLRLASDHGVTPDKWDDHFHVTPQAKLKPVKVPIELRRSKQTIGGTKRRGFLVPFDPNGLSVKPLVERVVAINAFFAAQRIEGATHRGFKRIFSEGTDAGYQWNAGGRFYSIGPQNYQTLKPENRRQMSINGESVVEIDITASHLTILHGLRGATFDPSTDPYAAVPGLPRKLVKTWVTMTLGHDRFHARWPAEAAARLNDLPEARGDAINAFPIAEVRRRIIASLPILADWPESPVRWTDLQFVESEVIAETMAQMAFDHATPCLPVHDSIIIPASSAALAQKVLERAFEARVGIRPACVVHDHS